MSRTALILAALWLAGCEPGTSNSPADKPGPKPGVSVSGKVNVGVSGRL